MLPMANLQQDEFCTTQQHQHHMHGSSLSVSCNIGLHPTLPQDGCNIDCRISQLEVHALHLPCTQARLVGAVTLLPCKCAAPLPPLLLPDWCVYDVCNRVQARGLTQPTVSSHSFSNSWNPTHVRVIQSRLTCSPAALWCCSLC